MDLTHAVERVEVIRRKFGVESLAPQSDAERIERRTKWQGPPKEIPAVLLGKYAAMVTSAGAGAILTG
jgi:hypothetical protein